MSETTSSSFPIPDLNPELEKEISDFENWLKNEDVPEINNNGKISIEDAKMNFLLASNLIIALAKKGRTRTKIFKYLKARKKITGTYQTFCNHLKRSGIDQYFIDPLEKIKNSLPPKEVTPTSTIPPKTDEKPKEEKVETVPISPTTPLPQKKPFTHNPSLPPEKLEELMGKPSEETKQPKKNPFFS